MLEAASPSATRRTRGVQPESRIILAFLFLLAVQVSAPERLAGLLFVCALLLLEHLLWRASKRTWRQFSLFSLAMFAPSLLLTPWIATDVSAPLMTQLGLDARLGVGWSILVKGWASVMVCAVSAASLDRIEAQAGLARLPLPRMSRAILVQILHQSAGMAEETQRIAAAFRLRTGRASWLQKLGALASLPMVWLPRVIQRAERLTQVMELRDFDASMRPMGEQRRGWRDALCLGMGVVLVALSGLLRWSEW
jgi:energy-coupling factor transporter transmembrane protein EcfT